VSLTTTTDHSSPPETPPSVWSSPYRLLTLGLLLVVAAAAFEALSVATILPATVRELGDITLYGWVFSAFMLTNLIGLVFAGTESDRQGPVRPFIIGVACFTAGLVTAGLAPSMEVVIAGRVVQGFGAGTITSVAYVVIGRGYPPAAKPRMLALLSSAWVIPGLFGPALAGLVADHLGWRWVFLGLAALPPLAASMALPAMRRLAHASNTPRAWGRMRAALRLALGAGMMLTSLELQPLLLTALLLLPGALLAGFALRALLPPGTLRAAPGLPAAIAAMGLLNLAFFGVDSFVPLELTATRGQTATVAGLTLTAATLCWTTGAWLEDHYAKSKGRRPMVLLGLVFIAIGIGGIAAVLLPLVPIPFASLAWGAAGLGIGLAYTTISLVVLETAPAGHEGEASASMSLASALGVALGTGIGGVFVGAAHAVTETLRANLAIQDALMIGAVALAALAASRLYRHKPGEKQASEAEKETPG
jgi:MFS family permease